MRIEAGAGLPDLHIFGKSMGAILQKSGTAIAASGPASVKKSADGPIRIAGVTAPEASRRNRNRAVTDGSWERPFRWLHTKRSQSIFK
jgi:hypothetical protein